MYFALLPFLSFQGRVYLKSGNLASLNLHKVELCLIVSTYLNIFSSNGYNIAAKRVVCKKVSDFLLTEVIWDHW